MTDGMIQREVFGNLVVLRVRTTSIDKVSVAAIEAACATMTPITVLDFSDVAFINSEAISSLLQFVASARRSGYKFFVIHLSPHHERLFQKVEMLRFMPTINERDLAAYRAQSGQPPKGEQNQ